MGYSWSRMPGGAALVAGLMLQAQRLASAEGAKAICVIANPRAKDFYRVCGFTVIGEAATRFGLGLRMCLKLP